MFQKNKQKPVPEELRGAYEAYREAMMKQPRAVAEARQRYLEETYGAGIKGWTRRIWDENKMSMMYVIIFTSIGVLMLQCSKYLSGY